MKELIEIQGAISVPKKLYNSFGKYSYRSAECILEAAKPLLHKHGCTLNLSDEVVLIGERYYVRAVATIRNSTGEEVSTTAYAREAEDKKGMDPAQVTGATSSYARKCALNGLLALDDVKDTDATSSHHGKDTSASATPPKPKQAQTPPQPAAPKFSRAEAEEEIKSCRSMQELVGVWGRIAPADQKQLVTAKDKKKQELMEAGKRAQTPQPEEPEQSLAEAHGWIDSCRSVQELAGVWDKITAVNKRRLEVLRDKKEQELMEVGK